MLRINTKTAIISLFAAALTLGAIAQEKNGKGEHPRPTNLKVLSKKISNDSLSRLMREYSVSLGVRCNFCHAASGTDKGRLDFASDDNKHKLIARDMMRMTERINRKYFDDDDEWGKEGKHHRLAVTCFTCHNGHKEPVAFVMPPAEEKH
jgi:hypothetical protein